MRKITAFTIFLLSLCATSAQDKGSVEMLFVGDLMAHQSQIDAACRHEGFYDFSHSWQYVQEDISKADIAVANLETPLGYSDFRGYPRFRAPVSYLTAAVDAGFDVFLLANNHIYDHYASGLRTTVDILDSVGVHHTGAWKDTLDYYRKRVLFVEKKGIRFAILNYTYGTNIPSSSGVVVNYRDSLRIKRDIEIARAGKADVIISSVHWGVEYDSLPSTMQTDYTQYMIDQGVRVVIGTHPHVLQPMYSVADSTGRIEHVVAYSLGNYLSGQRTIDTRGGASLRMTFTKDSKGVVHISSPRYSLVWVRRYMSDEKREKFTILPLHKAEAGMYHLSPSEQYLMQTFARRVRTLFSQRKVNIKEYTY